ncbi:CIA30 family protein [Candidatus Thioglobus sp.]|nr:CIA30 family protein [Candidatus Thioglobus sp.]MDB3893060.1 CIA30 family protein [Candidatus Thioglobus sp.]MDC0388595.1 CIA30 family protein [Candidatus Thioglobus sp.]MDC0904006.1 CIA30 family protein [Candidatus Thioglobus sp.]MDC0920364.1 CIA30 family protein [Candidatus Thioglobus sp.]
MNLAVIDNRNNNNLTSTLGTKWQLVTDAIMGGLSQGQLSLDVYKDKNCLRMRGNVTTENNGGFVQIALPLSKNNTFDASDYSGVEIEVAGNSEIYNIHFRTDELWFPWQSYRSSFKAESDWKKYRIPFKELDKYKTFHEFSQGKIKRIGLVAIGREFQADLCLADIRFYNE